MKYFSGPEWIKKYILNDKFVFVISGTHGKTTTTSMLIKILQESKLNPSYLLGGVYLEEKISYKFTNSKYFIIEAHYRLKSTLTYQFTIQVINFSRLSFN